MSQFKLHKRKKREVWVAGSACRWIIRDAKTMKPFGTWDNEQLPGVSTGEERTWTSRTAAESFAKEHGWKVV